MIVKNHQSQIPPDEVEVRAFVEGLENADSWTDVKLPPEVEGCLAFLCSRQAINDPSFENHSTLKPSITWLVKASLFEISRSGVDSSADPFYGLRVLLSGISIPQRLCESEIQKLLANSGETDTSITSTSTPSESSKKKVKKAQIAKELWDDVSSAVSELNGDHVLRISNTYSSIARAVFWKERGNEVLLNCLQIYLKILQNSPKVDLKSIAKKVFLLCQILHGALSDPANPTCTLSSMPSMFVNNWIKSVFKTMIALVQTLVPALFTRNAECVGADFIATDVFDTMVLLQEAFFSLFSTSDKRQVECSELDAAHLWFNLCLISNYCLPPPNASSDAPLKLLSPTSTSFTKFTTFALERLRGELQNSFGSTSSVLVNRLLWSREGEGWAPMEVDAPVNSSSEWARTLSSVDAYERFVLEADFRLSLVLSGPLDVFLLDLASAFFAATKTVKSESTDENASLLLCAENAILTLSSLFQLREMHNTLTAASDKDAFIRSLVYLISLHPEPLGRCLTALFCVLAPTPITPATLSCLHLLPPDPQLSLDPQPPVTFRLLATYLLDASCSQPNVIETYCTAAVSSPFTDLPPHMAQLISLLSAAFSSHASKKTLLSAIVDTLIDPAGVEVLRSLRLVVLLRYQLHYIFDPPRHLNAQVRPAILGTGKKVVWEFTNLVGRGPSEGYFYDLLHGKSKTSSTIPTMCPAPPQDGLAIMTLVARSDYDRVFTRMLLLFDSWWQSTPLYAAYGAQLSWRLLEILPPSAGFVEEISSVVNGAELEEDSAHHRIIYLLVLFDRLRRLPTSISSSSLTSENAEKEAKRSRHRIEAIANETFKAQSSRRIKPTKPAFSSVEGYEVFFSVLRSYKTHLPVLLTEALNQLQSLQKSLEDGIHLTESHLVFWRVVVHALRTLFSRIQAGGKLHTPGETEPPPLMTGAATATKKGGSEPLKVCSTGTQSAGSVGASAEVADITGQASKKPGLNPELSYFFDSFLQNAVTMMEYLLQQLRAELGFSSGGVVECLCPDRLVASGIENSFLLDKVMTGRLVDALRRASSGSDEEEEEINAEGARLYAWNKLVRENGLWDWPISETDTLSQVAFNRLTNASVESASTPRSILIGCLLKETALFAEAIVQIPRGSVASVFRSISVEEKKTTLTNLSRLQLNPLVFSLGIDLSGVQHYYAAYIKNVRTEMVLTRTTEDLVLDTLVFGAVNVTSKHLRAEIFAYLEAATGLPRVLRRFASGDLPLFKGLYSNPVLVEYLRLFCLFLLRATNPPSSVELYTTAAKQALQIALDDKVIANAVSSVLDNREGTLSQRYCIFVERMLRLIAAPWAGADETKELCLEILLWAIKPYECECPIRGYFIVSGMRCLLLTAWNASASAHLRFAEILACWAERGQTRLAVEECVETKKSLLLTLCAIYDYFGLLLRAFASSAPVDSDSLALPDSHYTENRNRAAVRGFQNLDLAKFFGFFTHLSTDDDGCYHMLLGSGWNSALDNCLLHALCGPAVGRNTVVPRLLSTLPFHLSASPPLERACEEVCTFASTQHHYIRQPWYGCNTCGIVTNRGSCHLCARVCHRGHDLVYQNTSEFFCDCATEMGQVGKCHSMMRRVAGGGDGLLENLLPWTNVTCFQPSVYDKACDLIAKAAYRLPSASVEATSAATPLNPLSTIASATNTSNTATPMVSACSSSVTPATTTATAAPALPPRNSEWITAESGSSDANIIHRIRRAGALRRRPGLVASKSTSREGGGGGGAPVSAASTVSQPPIDLVPCLSVIYGLGGEEGWRKKFNLWALDSAAPRRRAVENFQRKFGHRPQPFFEPIVKRLRSQLNKYERGHILNIIRSPAIFRGACNLLREELTPLLHSAIASFADVFKRVAEPENLRFSAIQHLTSANRKSPHRVIISLRLVTPLLFFDTESTAAANEVFQLLLPLPASPIPSPSVTSVVTPNLLSSVFPALDSTITGGRQRRTATDLNSLHHWIADVFAPRRSHHLFDSSAAPSSSMPPGSNAIEGRTDNASANDAIATLARVPSVCGWRHYLLIAMALPLPSPASRSREEGSVSVFQVDDLFTTAAACQESVEGAVRIAPEAARDTLPSSRLRSFVVRLSSLPRVSKVNCGFEVTRLAVHPTNEAVFTASNQQMCVVFGLSTLGQVCGRLLINPLIESKDEFVIKPIWLPGSSRFIALLTTKSVQIFDIFTNSPKLLYYFKPVEGNFVDATFIHAPRRRKGVTSSRNPTESTIDKYHFSDVILVVMATFGSMMLQRLLLTTRVSQGHFYLAESLDWESAGLCELADTGASALSLDSLRNSSTGTMAEGGASVFYAPSLHLLLHSYNSGHTFATAVDFSDDGTVRVNHSFLLTGAKASSSSGSTPASSSLPQPKDQTNNATWSGPLHDWAEVVNHSGVLTATATETTTTGSGTHSLRRNLMIAVEPDTVWIQPLPLEAQKPLSKSTDEANAPVSVASSKPEGNVGGESSAPSLVAASITRYWSGNQSHEPRLFTLQISRSSSVQVLVGPPESRIIDTTPNDSSSPSQAEKITFASKHNLLPTLPGQFWLQPALLYREPQSNFKAKTPKIPMLLEDLLLWDVSTNSMASTFLKPEAATIRDFASYALSALPALRIILEKSETGPQPPFCDFHEWASISENVNFYSRDLMSIYNHETLNQRLKREGMPVTFSGRSLASPPQGVKPNGVAFVIDIEVTRPTQEVIVGLRVELTDTCRPQFLSVCNRVFSLDSDKKSSKKRQLMFVDLSLKLSEILQVGSEENPTKELEPIRLYVGQSQHSDTLTSIDRILVYTVPRSLIDPSLLVSHDSVNTQNQQAVNMQELMLRLSNKEARVARYNTSLVKWFDRLMMSGFVTSIATPLTQAREGLCEFTTPLYDNVGDLGSCVVATITDFFQSAIVVAQEPTKFSLEELQPFLTPALTKFLLEAFVHPNSTTMCTVTDLIRLHASCGNEDSTASLIAPRTILGSLISDFLKVFTSSATTPSRLFASTSCLAQFSRVWQLAHEYGGGVNASASNDLTIQLFTALQEHLLFSEEEVLLPNMFTQLNSLWVKLLQDLLKVAVFVLAESCCDNSSTPSSSVPVLGDLIVRLLTHKQSQIACNTRDLLCSTLVCLFTGNCRIAKHLFYYSPFPSRSGPSLSSQPPKTSASSEKKEEEENSRKGSTNNVNDDDDVGTLGGNEGSGGSKNTTSISTFRLRRIRCPRVVPKRQSNLGSSPFVTSSVNNSENSAGDGGGEVDDGNIEEIGRTLNEMLQFIASATNILGNDADDDEEEEDNQGGAGSTDESLRHRWDGALSRYQSLREAVDEIRRSFGSRRRGRPSATVVLGANDPIRFMDELSEFEEDIQHQHDEVGNSQDGYEADSARKYGLFDDDDGTEGNRANENEGNVENAGGEEVVETTEEDNDEGDGDDDNDDDDDECTEGNGEGKSGNSEGEIEPTQAADDGDDEHTADMARDIFQYVVDLLSTHPADSKAAGNSVQETVDAPQSSGTSRPHVISRDNEGGGGSSSSGNDTLSHESGLFDTAFLEHIDEDVILNLALQRSIRDQGGPGTAALLEEQAAQFRVSPQATDESPLTTLATTNASNSTDAVATPAAKSTVWTQVLPSNSTENEVGRKTSKESLGSPLSEGLLLDLFEDMDVPPAVLPSTPTSSCASWSFSSHMGSSSYNGDDDGSDKNDKDDGSSDGEDDGGDGGGGSTPPSSPPPDPPSGTWSFLPRDRQSLSAARACIALTRHLVTVWARVVDVGDGEEAVAESEDSKRLMPLMQTTFTLCRLLEAIAQCSGLPEPEEDLKETADAARTTLADLVTTLTNSLLRLHHHYQQPETSRTTPLKPTLRSERLLLVISLLSHVLCVSSASAAVDNDKNHEDGGSGGSEEHITASPTALLVGKTVLSGLAGLDSSESFFSKCMDACLGIVEGLSAKWEKSHNWHFGENMSSSALVTTTSGRRGYRTSGTFNLPHLTAGLLQCARGINFSSLTNGFGAGLTNCAPILDAQASLVHLHAPLHVDFDLQLTEAAVRLAIALFTCVRTGGAKRESSGEYEEIKKRWCAVVYNLLESLTSESSSFTDSVSTTATATSSSKIDSSVSIIGRLVGLMRSLLIYLVGQKHYRQLKDIHLLSQALIRMRGVYKTSMEQEDNAYTALSYLLPLSYPSECLMLNCINTCLDVALSDRSSWQRLCIRKSDDLVFMLEASLRVRDVLALGLLTLVLVAILPDAKQAKLGMTTFRGGSSSSATKTAATATSGCPATTSYATKLVNMLSRLLVPDGEGRIKDPSAFLLNFVRGNICCRADQRIRCTASLIITALAWYSENDSFSTLLLQHLPKLWSELPSFALYGDELALLSIFLFKRHPNWSGTTPFCNQLLELLLSQINSVAEHPLRDIYKAVLKCHSVSGFVSSIAHHTDDPPFAGLHLPPNFISTVIPTYLPGLVSSNLIGCPFDSEPCLLCNRSLLSLPYVLFQWNSSTPSRRRGNTSTSSGGGGAQGSTSGAAGSAVTSIYPMPTYSTDSRLTNTPHLATYTQASVSTAAVNASVGTATPIQPTPTTTAAPPVIELEPPTWVSPNVHIFSLLDTWEIASIGVRFMAPAPGLRNVRTLNIFTSDAFECPPSRLMRARHLWRRLVQVDIPPTKYNVLIHLAAEADIVLPVTQDPPPDASSTVEVRLSEGLPLTANSLIFHYAAFHGSEEGGEEGDGDTEGGGERRSRRRRCCRCNVTILQGSTCQHCKQNGNQCSRCLFINLSDEEVFLCTKCGSSNYNFMNFSMLARPNLFHVSRLRDEEDRRVALSRIVGLTEELNTQLAALGLAQKHLFGSITVGHPPLPYTPEVLVPLFWPRDCVIKSVSEAERVQQAAFPLVCRLWALRQAVSIYDGRCAANSMEVTGADTAITTAVSSRGGDDRCLRCVEAAICLITNMASTFTPSVFSVEARKECISRGLPLAHSLSPVVQMRLVGFLNHITSNSIALINHLGDNIVERLLALSECEKEMFEFERSSYFNIVSLGRGVKSIIALTPPCGVDADYFCQEARLRTVFRLLLGLTRRQQEKLMNGETEVAAPPVAVMESILVECIRFLCDLFILPDNVKNWWWERGVADFRPPRVNFEAWMRGDEAASFSTWREHYQLAVEMAKTEERVRRHITSTAPRELALSARFALRWLRKTAQAKLPPLPGHCESAANPGGWLSPILFHSFASRQYMSHQDSGLNLLTNLCLDTASTSSNRSAECLCYLASQYVPYLDHLVRANRGSGLTDEALRVNPLVMFMWDLTSGNTIKGTAVMKRTLRSCSAFVSQSSTTTTASTTAPTIALGSMTPLLMRPLLLYRGKLLDHVETLLQRTLTTLSAIEGVGGGNRPSLPALRNWTDCLPPQLAPVSGSSAAPGANPGYTLMHIADLLAILQPLNDLALEHQDRLYSYFLHAIVSLQSLVYQRTIYTVKAELLFKEMLQQLMQNASSRAPDLIRITMDYLVQCPVQTDDQSSAVFLLKRICACACPLPTEVAPFPVRISVWRDQEEYLFVRRVREVVMSNTRGFGPTISDVINYICAENNLTTDMRLEVVCENSILMPQLLLENVYKYLWLQNPTNANKAMELIYRIPGLEADNLPYVSRLPHPNIPEEQYSRLVVLTEHPQGLAVILNRLDVVKDALKCRDLLHVSVHLLEYCLKVPQCQSCLVDPQYRAIPILLDALYACLQVMHQSTSDFHDQVTSRLVGILTTLLHSAATTASDADSLGLSRLLSCLALHPDLEVVQSGVAQLPGLLAFGAEPRMTAIVDFLRQHIVEPLLMSPQESDGKAKSNTKTDLLQCCCALVTAIPFNTLHGRRLRARVVSDLALLELCVAYLWRMIPAVLDQSEETTLDTKSPALSAFLYDDSLPFVLQLLRGCVWAVSNPDEDPPTPPFPDAPEGHTTRQLLAFLHKLEDSKSVGRVGLLTEDLLNEWVAAGSIEGSTTPASSVDLTTIPGVVATVRELRTLSEQRHRRNARECREKYLLSLNMKVNEKGQVAMTTASKLAEMAAQVVEETGLQCAICHEGPRSSPREELGIYVFIRRRKLEESLADAGSASTASVASTQAAVSSADTSADSEGYTTVSSFVVVHFECHARAVQASNLSEWSVATRHNRDARCNCLLPVLMNEVAPDAASKDDKKDEKAEKGGGGGEAGSSESMDDLYAKRVSTYAIGVTMQISLQVSTRLALHDIKLLLLRFAHKRSFHGETGGGAAESNLNLIPHLMQLAFFQMKKEQAMEPQRANLMCVLEKPESYWSNACWEVTGPLYSAVVALHLLSRGEWDQHRVSLLRHLMALAHARATDGVAATESPAFTIYKPYLLFFGLIQAFYEYFFKTVKAPTDQGAHGCWWPEAVSRYIRSSDEQLLAATPELLSFFENDLSPIESVEEFLDVVGMLGEVDAQELIQLATTGSR